MYGNEHFPPVGKIWKRRQKIRFNLLFTPFLIVLRLQRLFCIPSSIVFLPYAWLQVHITCRKIRVFQKIAFAVGTNESISSTKSLFFFRSSTGKFPFLLHHILDIIGTWPSSANPLLFESTFDRKPKYLVLTTPARMGKGAKKFRNRTQKHTPTPLLLLLLLLRRRRQ